MFIIRLADERDIKKVFELSNDDEVRKNSIHQEKILWENHKKWFLQRIRNVEEPFFVAESDKEEFIAQIRFNFEENEGFVISVSIEKSYRGKGLAPKIIQKSVEKLKTEQMSKIITAFVKPNNIASQKSFIKAGFKLCGEKKIEGETYERYVFS